MYGGTKAELERLIADAASYTEVQKEMGITVDASSTSFDNIVNAIAVVQGKLGVAGATALEAGTTIEGSANSMKAAWDNLITGLGDENADMAELITNLLGSTVTVAENLLPVVERILENIGVVVQEKGPEMIEKFVGYAVEKLPQVIELGMKMVLAIVSGLANNLPQIVRSVLDVMATIVKTFVSSLPDIVDVGKQIVKGLWEGIKAMGSWIKEKVSGFIGGIVDNVKGVLGIHSPSKVFAGIGGFMAEGLAEGWDKEYNGIKRSIENGLNFGAATVDFSSSGLGVSSAGIINTTAGWNRSAGGFTGPIELILKSDDGQQFGRWMVPFIRSEDKSNPEVVSDAV